jgi:hypothetical protein
MTHKIYLTSPNGKVTILAREVPDELLKQTMQDIREVVVGAVWSESNSVSTGDDHPKKQGSGICSEITHGWE